MAATIDEITVNFSDEEGTLLCRELEKVVLSKGAWCTVMFRYQNLDKASGKFTEPKFTIRRYQKVNGEFRPKSKFNVSSKAQAQNVADTLIEWISKPDPEE